MKIKKKIISILMSISLTVGAFGINTSFADSSKVVTLGVNNSESQKQTILKYFGVKENEVEIITVNNQEERAYLGNVATEEQLGHKTYSCAYVEPTTEGSGINVKTANITWVTSSMVASTLSTAGLTGANCVIAAVFPVSGTGALTGVMKAFESATGEKLDEDKKQLASEELVTTGDLGDDIGQDKATGIVNDVKTDIIKNNTHDKIQIAETINNITNNYNVTLTDAQVDKIVNLMEKIAKQNYNYDEMKPTLNNVSDVVSDNLKDAGENITSPNSGGFLSSIGDWFANLFGSNKDLGILGSTDDSMLGKDTIVDATNEAAENLPSGEEVEGFFTRIWNWFKDLFNGNSNDAEEDSNNNNNIENNNDQKDDTSIGNDSESTPSQEDSNKDNSIDSSVEDLEQNSTVDENVQPDSSIETDSPENSDTQVENPSEDDSNTNDSLNTLDNEGTTQEQN